MKPTLTDEQIEQEIERLNQSPLVRLARKEARIRYRRRQYYYNLKMLEKKGKELMDAGISEDMLEEYLAGIPTEECEIE